MAGTRISGASVVGTSRGLPPPSPVVTAMYCRPSIENEIGKPCTDVDKPRAPQHLAVPHVNRLELAIEVADKRHAPGRREHGGQERCALLQRPRFLHAVHVEGCELADVAIGAWHLIEAPVGAAAAATARDLLDLLRANRDAALAERNDQLVGGLVVAHRLPVVSTLGARAPVDPLRRPRGR